MATIEIVGWKDEFIGLIGWERDKSELRKWLRRGIKASPSTIKRLAHQIEARQLVSLDQVHDDAVYWLTNILQRMGAEFRASLDTTNNQQLFKNCPPR